LRWSTAISKLIQARLLKTGREPTSGLYGKGQPLTKRKRPVYPHQVHGTDSLGVQCLLLGFENGNPGSGRYPPEERLKSMVIWKISHGRAQFTDEERTECLRKHLVLIGMKYAKYKQGLDFINKMHKGDIFYLCHASEVQLLGQITSEKATPFKQRPRWWKRSYKQLQRLSPGKKYRGDHEMWTPSGYSTCVPIRENDIEEFEKRILRPFFKMRLSDLGTSLECDKVAAGMESGAKFDFRSREGAEKRVIMSIAQRRGQPRFRRYLMELYEGKCAISDYNAPEALEAAHIIPHRRKAVYRPQNGLLLRADLHTLFDLHLITIDPRSMKVRVDPSLMGTEYREFAGKSLRLPKIPRFRPNKEALEQHREAGKLSAKAGEDRTKRLADTLRRQSGAFAECQS